MVFIRCPKVIEPAVKVVYSEFPKFAATEPRLSMAFLVTAFIILLVVVILMSIYLLKKK